MVREPVTEVIVVPLWKYQQRKKKKTPDMHLVNKGLRFILRIDQGSAFAILTAQIYYYQRGTGTDLPKQQPDAAKSGDEHARGQVRNCLVAQISLCGRMGFLQKSIVA